MRSEILITVKKIRCVVRNYGSTRWLEIQYTVDGSDKVYTHKHSVKNWGKPGSVKYHTRDEIHYMLKCLFGEDLWKGRTMDVYNDGYLHHVRARVRHGDNRSVLIYRAN